MGTSQKKKECEAICMTEELVNTYLDILAQELVPAMGCTEPIAIAYCGAKVRNVLGGLPEQLTIG